MSHVHGSVTSKYDHHPWCSWGVCDRQVESLSASAWTRARMSRLRTLGQEAVALAEEGARVLPLFEPTDSGCSCGQAGCPAPGKHPRTRNGHKDASSDPTQVQTWWSKTPNANIGIATGEG